MSKAFLRKLCYFFGFTPNGLRNLVQYTLHMRIIGLFQFWHELHCYKKELKDKTDIIIQPCLGDRKSVKPIDKYYFYQDIWGAKIAFSIKPKWILCIGSSALLTGILSQFTETVFLDIRPLSVSAEGLMSKKGSITKIPFPDNSVDHINSLCVIEHIGLGRYGDPVDSQGIEKAAMELRRVIRPSGYLVVSVPIGPPCIVFNAHRVFSRDEFLGMFPDFELEDEIFCVPEYTKIDLTPNLKKGEYHIFCVCLKKKSAKKGENDKKSLEPGRSMGLQASIEKK